MFRVCALLLFIFAFAKGFLEFNSENGFSSADISALKTRLEDETAKRILLQNDLTVVMGKLEALNRRLQAVESLQVPGAHNPVVFNAHLNKTISPVGPNQRIIFDDVKLNLGGAYHVNHGSFSAPTNGTYLFSVSICSKAGHWVVINLMRNSALIGRVLAGDTAYDECSSETFLTELNAGDDIYLVHNGSDGDLLYAHPRYWNVFTGSLLQAY